MACSKPSGLCPFAVQLGSFTFSTSVVSSLSGNVGSLAGGLPLTLSIGGAGLPAGLNAGAVAVTVGGLPCPLIGTPTPTQVTCRAPAAPAGTVFVDYYNLGAGNSANPMTLDILGKPPAGERHHPFEVLVASGAPLLHICPEQRRKY